MPNILHSYPGYDLKEPHKVFYRDGDVIAVPYATRSHGTLYHFYTLGSVVGYALQYGEDPEASLARARANGHQLHWASLNGTCISDTRPAVKPCYPLHAWGDVIDFHGRHFQLNPDYNHNAKLVEVT